MPDAIQASDDVGVRSEGFEPSTGMQAESPDPDNALQDVVKEFGGIPPRLWNEETQEDVAQFLEEEIGLADSERSDFMDDLERWQEVYKAAPADGPKNFPIRNSSNLTIPVAKEIVNTLTAQLTQTTLTNRPLWIFEDLAPEWSPFVGQIEKFMDIAAERDLGFHRTAVTWILECVKYGTSILQVDYDIRQRSLYQYNLDGTEVIKRNVTKSDGPRTVNVPIEDFYIRLFENDPQDARWVAKRLRLNEVELRDRVASGKFSEEAVDELIGWAKPTNDQISAFADEDMNVVQKAREEESDQEPLDRGNTFEVYEVWLSWDVDGDGRFEELLLYYHVDSRIFLSSRFNPYWHGDRPFINLTYFPIENMFYGEGVIAQVEEFQKEISSIHNQRMDNSTLANLKMIIKRKMEQGLKPGDPLYTGKIIEVVGDVNSAIREFQLSEIYPSTVANEEMSRAYVERVSGAGEAQLRGSMPVTRTTATAQLALLQEQSKRFDMTVRDFRDGFAEVGRLAMGLYLQFGTNEKALMWLGEKGRIVDAVFRLPKRVIEIGLGIKASSPTSQLNKEQRRQNSLAIWNLLNQMYTQLLEMTAQIAPQAIGVVANEMVQSAHHFMRKALADFDQADPENVLAGLTVLERILPTPEDFGGLSDFERRAERAKELEALERLEGLVRQVGRAEEGRGSLLQEFRDRGGLRNEEGILGRLGDDNGGGGASPGGIGRARGGVSGPRPAGGAGSSPLFGS